MDWILKFITYLILTLAANIFILVMLKEVVR